MHHTPLLQPAIETGPAVGLGYRRVPVTVGGRNSHVALRLAGCQRHCQLVTVTRSTIEFVIAAAAATHSIMSSESRSITRGHSVTVSSWPAW
jgi:hypothetical protein